MIGSSQGRQRSAKEHRAPSASSDGVALHLVLSLLLKDGITSGRYRPGDRLPTEDELALAHKVSRVTVRRALLSLEKQGYIERRPRRGTVVSSTAAVLTMPSPIEDYLRQVSERRTLSRHRVLDFTPMPATPEVAASLQCRDGDLVLRVERLRVMGSLPIAHSTVYLPEPFAARLTRRDFTRHPLSVLLAREGVHYGRIDLVTRARLASPSLARLLSVTVASPLVDVQRIAYSTKGTPVEFQILAGPSDRFETHVSIRAFDRPGAEPD